MKNLSHRLHWLFACLFILIFLSGNYSQETIKFGKIDIKDLKMSRCPFDSSADAMVLGDIGKTYFAYDEQEGFMMMFERFVRIKIFTKKGYPEANMEIPFYHSDQEAEKIVTLKARTYNLENGKIIETKVADESIFDEEVDAYWKNKKITFPGVREGSVVELKYIIRSPFLANLRNWYFQGSLPIAWSEYEVSIPEYFFYSKQASGSFPFVINETSTSQQHINQTTNQRGYSSYVVTHNISTSTVDYVDNISKFATKNVPAFKEEPYTNTINNYVSKIEYEFTGYKFPNGPLNSVNSTWEEIVETLEKDADFGQQIKRGGVVKDIVNEIESKSKDPFGKMKLAYEYVQTTMKWNETNSKYPTSNLRNALQEKTGNSADINLLLVLLLRELGISSDPVILSTREHGVVIKTFPSISKMNYVIAVVTMDGKYYLLDATSRVRPYTMLSFECLNGDGLVISKETMRWIPLVQEEKYNTLFFAEMNILPEGEIKGKLIVSKSGYAGVNARNSFIREGTDKYKKSLKENLKSWSVEEIILENYENPEETVKDVYQLSSTDIVQVAENMIYLNVFLNLGQNSNPFQQEKRDYPVDFGCPQRDSYVYSYEIPEGYVVESLPESIKIALPEQGGTFKFFTSIAGNKIAVSSQLVINKTFFLPSEYLDLREFFNKITTKHAQQIVLKKV